MKKTSLPGSIYLNNGRFWWKVKLAGESKLRARPLKPVGGKFATKDFAVAKEVAYEMLQRAIFQPRVSSDKDNSIGSLVQAYLEHAQNYYLGSDGKVTREPENIRYALVPLVGLYASLPAEDFDIPKLKEVRQRMIENNWCRGVVNQRIGIIKRMFRWAAQEQRVPTSVYQSVQILEGLHRGRCGARETEPIGPVAESNVRAILPFLPPTVSAMVQIQLLTGARSTEICLLRPCDVETGGTVWLYRPSEHKTRYRGQERIVALGPKSQHIIKPFLGRKLDDFCFKPSEAQEQRGQGQKPFKSRYDRNTYRRAIVYAIQAARRTGLDIPDFTPHQFRHTAGTRVRKEFGLDAARAVLGHRSAQITEEYAELDQTLAKRAALRLG